MPPNRVLALQRATVETLAIADDPLQKSSRNPAREVIERIKKCLARSNHANANQHEAETAVRMAHAFITQHNIDQAQLIEDEEKDKRAERGGLSTVIINRAEGHQIVRLQTWTEDFVISNEWTLWMPGLS